MTESGRNRRRENRVSVRWKAKAGSKGLGVGAAVIRNISLSGVYFETRLKLAEQSRIFLESELEHSGKTHTLLVECTIMRSSPSDHADIQGYGARFVMLGKANLSFLLPLIAELWVQQRDQSD